MRTLEAVRALTTAPGVVLGLGQNGLATVRALGRRGIPVIGLDANLEQPTARSRYCLPVRCGNVRTEDGLLSTLLELGAALPHRGVLFPSGDLNLLVVSEQRELLAPYYHLALPVKEAVRLILDKQAFYAWATEHGFTIPRTHVLGPEGPGAVASRISYPAVLKPHLRDAGWRRDHDVKLYEVHSADDLRRTFERLARTHPQMLVQECIPGPDSQLVFSLTYLDADLEPLAMFTGRKLRQFPPRFGTSSMAESRWDPEVAELSLRILRALGYRGYGSVEFKRDPRDGALRIIEVTGRTWYPHGLATACGVNLPYLAYRHLLGQTVERPRGFREGVKWIDEDRDLRAARGYHALGYLGPGAWLASYRGKRTWAISALDDPAPGLHLAARWGRSLLRAVAGRRPPGRRAPSPAPGPAARAPRALEHRALEGRLRSVLHGAFYVAKRAGLPGLDFGDRRLAAIVRFHSVSGVADGNRLYVKPSIAHTPEVFDRQVAMLARRYRCVTMDDLLEALAGGKRLPPNAVVITFDDGYRDNYEHAYPILRRHGVPAIFYLTTGCLDGAEPLWTSQLRYVVHCAGDAALTDVITGARLDLQSPARRERAARVLQDSLVALPPAERQRALRELARSARVDLAPLRARFLRWSEVAEMRGGGMHIGSHTISHPLLPSIGAAEAEREIADSRAELSARLGCEILHFSYPNPGDGVHCSPGVRRLVARSGYATAVTSQQGYVQPGEDRLELGRLGVGTAAFRVPWDLERDVLRTLPTLSPPLSAPSESATAALEAVGLLETVGRASAILARLRATDQRAAEELLRQHVAALQELRGALELAAAGQTA